MASGIDPADPLFRPVTIAEAADLTHRSERTVRQWIRDKRITAYEVQNPREIVLIEKDVVELEKTNRDAFAAGRPRRNADAPDGANGVT